MLGINIALTNLDGKSLPEMNNGNDPIYMQQQQRQEELKKQEQPQAAIPIPTSIPTKTNL